MDGEKGPASCGKQTGSLCGFRGLSGKVAPIAGGPGPFSPPCLLLVLLGFHSPTFSQAEGPAASTLTPWEKVQLGTGCLDGQEAGWVQAENGLLALVCGLAQVGRSKQEVVPALEIPE